MFDNQNIERTNQFENCTKIRHKILDIYEVQNTN